MQFRVYQVTLLYYKGVLILANTTKYVAITTRLNLSLDIINANADLYAVSSLIMQHTVWTKLSIIKIVCANDIHSI